MHSQAQGLLRLLLVAAVATAMTLIEHTLVKVCFILADPRQLSRS